MYYVKVTSVILPQLQEDPFIELLMYCIHSTNNLVSQNRPCTQLVPSHLAQSGWISVDISVCPDSNWLRSEMLTFLYATSYIVLWESKLSIYILLHM